MADLDGECSMPPPEPRVPREVQVLAVPPRLSDMSTIAGTAYHRYVSQGGAPTRIRIFVCNINDREHTKVCSLNPQQTTELSDFVRIVARKLKMDQGLDEGVARLFLIQGGAHEIDGVEDIQDGDLIALDPGSKNDEINQVAAAQKKDEPAQKKAAQKKITVKTNHASSDQQKKKTPAKKPVSAKKMREIASLIEGLECMESYDGPITTPRRSLRGATRTRSSTKQPAATPVKEEPVVAGPAPAAQKHPAPTAYKKRKGIPQNVTAKLKKVKLSAKAPSNEKGRRTSDGYDKRRMNEILDMVEDDPYPVGKRFFVYQEDDGFGGHEYPAMILPPPKNKKLKANERYIGWDGYPGTEVVTVDQLLDYTDEKIEYHENVVVPMLQEQEEMDSKDKEEDDEESAGNFDVQPNEIYYVKENGIHYPVRVVKVLKTKDRAQIKFLDYRTVRNVWTKDLLRATPEREEDYNFQKQMREQKRLDELNKRRAKEMRKSIKKEEVSSASSIASSLSQPSAAPRTKARATAAKPAPKSATKPAPKATSKAATKPAPKATTKPAPTATTKTVPKATQLGRKSTKAAPKATKWSKSSRASSGQGGADSEFEPATDNTNLPCYKKVRKIGFGRYQKQSTRIVYVCKDSDTMEDVAAKFHLPVGKVFYDNRKFWGKIKATSLLMKGTPIVLPLTWEGKQVRCVVDARIPSVPSAAAKAPPDAAKRASAQKDNKGEESSDTDFGDQDDKMSANESDEQFIASNAATPVKETSAAGIGNHAAMEESPPTPLKQLPKTKLVLSETEAVNNDDDDDQASRASSDWTDEDVKCHPKL